MFITAQSCDSGMTVEQELMVPSQKRITLKNLLISLRQRTRSQELEMDCLLDEYEDIARGGACD
jgi:hypothetical protein